MLYHGKEIRYHEGGNDKNCYSSEPKSRGKCNILLSGPNEVALDDTNKRMNGIIGNVILTCSGNQMYI
jgi:hypothetical protein